MPEDNNPTTSTPAQPAPTTPPVAPQPIQDQYFTQPNAAPVQYVIQQRSLKGLRGWLMFFIVSTALLTLSCVTLFINALSNYNNELLATVIFTPLIAIASIVAITYAALEKKLARNLFIGVASLFTLYQIVLGLTSGSDVATTTTGVIISLLWLFFVVLYFLTSKRVKETLVK